MLNEKLGELNHKECESHLGKSERHLSPTNVGLPLELYNTNLSYAIQTYNQSLQRSPSLSLYRPVDHTKNTTIFNRLSSNVSLLLCETRLDNILLFAE